jgi:hypothetical protein
VNFIETHARVAKSQREIKSLLKSAYGDINVSKSKINSLIKTVYDEKITKMMKRTTDVLIVVPAAV